MSRGISIAILWILLCAASAWSDEIRFTNGDRLTGRIVRLTAGKLVIQSQVAGEITINLADIRTFTSDAAIEIHLKDGTVLHQPVEASEPNGFAIKAGEPLEPQAFKLSDVA